MPVKVTIQGTEQWLTAEPAGAMTLAAVAYCVSVGNPVFLALEPGDATRYELMIVPHRMYATIPSWGRQRTVTVVRYTSGHAREADNFRFPYEGRHVLENLGKSNGWTRDVLNWWFQELNHAVELIERDSANNAQSDGDPGPTVGEFFGDMPRDIIADAHSEET